MRCRKCGKLPKPFTLDWWTLPDVCPDCCRSELVVAVTLEAAYRRWRDEA